MVAPASTTAPLENRLASKLTQATLDILDTIVGAVIDLRYITSEMLLEIYKCMFDKQSSSVSQIKDNVPVFKNKNISYFKFETAKTLVFSRGSDLTTPNVSPSVR